MKNPNYKDQQSKHPIPHANDLIDKDCKVNQGKPKGAKNTKAENEEE